MVDSQTPEKVPQWFAIVVQLVKSSGCAGVCPNSTHPHAAVGPHPHAGHMRFSVFTFINMACDALGGKPVVGPLNWMNERERVVLFSSDMCRSEHVGPRSPFAACCRKRMNSEVRSSRTKRPYASSRGVFAEFAHVICIEADAPPQTRSPEQNDGTNVH